MLESNPSRFASISDTSASSAAQTGWPLPGKTWCLQGKLYGMTSEESQKRAKELIVNLDLAEFADRRVATYSGGQKRRLHVALGLICTIRISSFWMSLPPAWTPQNRANLVQIRKLRDSGTAIFLTTHYLEEADVLSDCLAIMDHGKIVAQGTSRELKQQIAGDSVVFSFKNDGNSIDRSMKLFLQHPWSAKLTSRKTG